MKKLNVGILGATGAVGQNFIRLLDGHPWFTVNFLAASPRSAGQSYEKAVAGRWVMETEIPQNVRQLQVNTADDIENAKDNCDLLFSAVNLDKATVRKLENRYAENDIPVVSANSAHRWTDDVPMIIPEVNPQHVEIIKTQRANRGWKKGFISVKPNCSLQSYMTPVFALIQAGYPIESLVITTMQAISGAGYPGVSAMDMIDNIVPLIKGEDEKTEREPKKILGTIQGNKIINDDSIKISAQCNRVPVIDGHTASVSVKFRDKKPTMDEIIHIWETFSAEPQALELPFAPKRPIIYRYEADRPQPRRDRNAEKAMAVSTGRLRECPVMDYRFVALSHNTVRGAAGGAILGAELLFKKGYLK